ncbi:MAG: Single-stranded-DNA-specific exonuclease RecJ [bacterium ADurb.Bin212]|nr:MAG: Single-stranded-DNA-specific exonuclease RecJ [bacterium ADurb.Bin212]
MKDNWKILPRQDSGVIEQLLFNRGLNVSEKEFFLRPDFEAGLCSPSKLPFFDIFLSRIKKAILHKERVAIYADYDADGIPGAAFLYKALMLLGLDVEVYIPSRDEGYGISQKGIDSLVEKNCSLIITVDLGIRNIEEANYALNHGVDLIITDHHLPGEELPKALAVINPKIAESNYDFKDLSGAGVIYKLFYGLKDYFSEISDSFLKWNLDLIAISTISDVVPLVGENRIMAKYGLKVINKSKNLGIRKIVEKSNLKFGEISSYEIGYVIAPRINAPGRLSTPHDSFLLLTTDNAEEADVLANNLERENTERQGLMEKLLKEAEAEINKEKLFNNRIIILCGNWHKGILGPCASKIAEKFSRPTILFSSQTLDNTLVGSARSINNINIMEVIARASKVLEKFGGHSGAAGLSVQKNNFADFKKILIEFTRKKISLLDLKKIFTIDREIELEEITFSLLENISLFEPFGLGNNKPLFLTRLSKLHHPKLVGKDLKHLSFVLEKNNKRIKSIYFNCSIEAKKAKHLSEIDLIYYVDDQLWDGKRYVQIKIVDMDLL